MLTSALRAGGLSAKRPTHSALKKQTGDKPRPKALFRSPFLCFAPDILSVVLPATGLHPCPAFAGHVSNHPPESHPAHAKLSGGFKSLDSSPAAREGLSQVVDCPE